LVSPLAGKMRCGDHDKTGAGPRTTSGVTGPISVVTSLLWILATSAILLVKPVWGDQRISARAAAS